MKVCSSCGKEKNESEFYKKRGGRDGLCAECKDCFKNKRKAYYSVQKQETIRMGIGHGSCVYCGNPILHRGSEYCSLECFHKATRTKTRACPVCGKEFSIDHQYRKYCSQSCFGKSLVMYPKYDFVYNGCPNIPKDFGRGIAGIYRITNTVNSKCYIGQSYNIKARIQQHRMCAISGKCRAIYSAIRKYGIGNFNFEILQVVPANTPTEDMDTLEKVYIKDHRSNNPHHGYNATSGGRRIMANVAQ